jgi:LacI family transcriptional regulator
MTESIRKTTITDLARELQLTPSTVSRALNNHPAISNHTKLLVQALAQQRHYQPNRIASALRLGQSHILGVLIPSAEINFFGSVIHGIENVARQNDYSVLIFQSNEDEHFEQLGVQTFLRSRVSCVLASLAKETTHLRHFTEIKRRGVPLVLFDRVSDELDVPSVVVNDYQGALLATLHLAQQGCRRIAHIAGQQHVPIFHTRLQGYRDALAQLGLPLDESLVVFGQVTIESGYQCMQQLMQLPEPPDAVFAVEDFTALGAIEALKDAGISIPQEVAIIGFANEAFGKYITPSLSTVDQQTIRMGEEAARLYFEYAEKGPFYESAARKVVLDPLLIYRNSSLRLDSG